MTPEYDDELSFARILAKKTSLVYGMGLSKEQQLAFVLPTLLAREAPLVVDADGLMHMIPYLNQKHRNKHLVLTPHLKELSTLVNLDLDRVQNNPVQIVSNLAIQAKAIVLCKGPSTIVSDGLRTQIIEVGHPGLATAGTGDVLAGIIATFLSQVGDGFEAVKQALIIFDRASTIAKNKHGEHGLIASDVIMAIPQAFLMDDSLAKL